jgi:anti-sigma B factor antagonist
VTRLAVDEERLGGAAVVRLRGTCRVGSSSDALKEALERISAEDSGNVVLDLAELTMLDSTALGIVAGTGRTLHAAGRELYLVAPNERVALLFKLTALDTVFPVVPTVESALGAAS